MNTTRSLQLGAVAFLLVAALGATVLSQGEKLPPIQLRKAAQKDFRDGNWRDAYENYRQLCLDEANSGNPAASDLNQAIQCLQRLGRINETDELLESTVKTHPEDWQVLQAAANQYLNLPHHGFMIAGEFERGPHRGGGRAMNSLQRDRVRALQLMTQAMPHASRDDNKQAVGHFYMNLANALLYNRGHYEAWRLQYATNLDELPDYEEGYPSWRNWTGAPVDEEGNPIFFTTARTWKDAENDGQRWRWALDQVVENDPRRRNEILRHRAQFCQNQFGVQTMQYYGRGWRGGRRSTGDEDTGTFALHTLKENETIARLATGIKRFKLPDEFNHIKLYQQVAENDAGGHQQQSLEQLANIFQNRRQYPKAADYWRDVIARHGPGHDSYRQQALEQIVGNWGRFEPVGTQPAGDKPTFEYTFRNADKVRFVAHKIKIDQLLEDVKAYLKSDPGRADWRKINIGNIGYRLVQQGEHKYLGDEAARWDVDLEPRENHWDRRITVAAPLEEAGAYLVTAQLNKGNVSKLVLWVADTAIVKKQLDGETLYYVADATGGKAVRDCEVEFFGYRQNRLPNGRTQIITTGFNDKTDEQGTLILDPTKLPTNFTWLITAKTRDGRFAYHGFHGVWAGKYYDAEYNQTKVFSITDRPVYRPGQTVKFKFWVRHAQYDKEDVSQFAGRTFPLELYSPQGEKIYTASMETDDYGGCHGEWKVPDDATLGQYRLRLNAREGNKWYAQGNGTFRVEEYKKPEYEVSIEAPSEPVMLGERIEAKIKAKYYFGSPVTKATVKYKIERTDYDQNWYPVGYWDWFYGQGYWWFAEDYPWYPGWHRWVGCTAPMPWWWHRGHNPPELVAENEVEIGPDGTVAVEIDTSVAKELHGDTDHKYTITAEVRDESRRTILGTGEVLVAREPFKVYSWVDRGHYRVGDTVHAHFQAQTLDNQPVQGQGELTLLKITYNEDAQPIETPVRRWDVDTNAEGVAQQQLRASAKGQYRLSHVVEDKAGHKIQGGYMFTIMGEGYDGKDYRFNEIELIPDKKTYENGDVVELQINTNQPNSTVLLFVRPANGICKPPKVIDIMGKTHIEEIKVSKKDMPNFYVEAVTVSGGKVYQKVKELIVPPEKRVVNVEVLPDSKEYLPSQKATVKLKLTDFNGNPFVGSTAVTMYDKSLEYISGGSNVGDIREFFWKWRRRHNPQHETNLARYFSNMTRPNETAMRHIGIYGATLAADLDTWDESRQLKVEEVASGQGRGGGFGGGVPNAAPLAQADAAAAPGAAALANGAVDRRANFAMDKPAAAKRKQQAGQAAGGDGSAGVEPTVRTKFADSAFWKADLRTNDQGIAEFELDMPENLTAWNVKVWAMGHGTKVGSGESEVVTRKNLIVRLQAPRFFVQKDEVVLSANVHNYLKTDKEVTVSLELPSEVLAPMNRDRLVRKVLIPADGEKRVDWRVKVVDEGTAVVRMKGVTDEESDAMEMQFPAYVHGMLKQEAWAGTVRPEQDSASVKIRVPSERRPEETRLEVRYSPTLAAAMVDALPYMLDYPYGCTEQTLNRFLPAVITQKTLIDMGIDLEDVKKKRTNLNAQELGDAAERARQWQRFDRNPVFDQEELDDIVQTGVKRLANMQVGDGGWGWFSGHWERSYPHTTAVVVHGLQQAQAADVELPEGMLNRGVEWLKRHQAGEVLKLKNAELKVKPWKSKADNLDALVYMVLADAGHQNEEMMNFLYRDKNDLAVYSKAMFGLALHKQGEKEKTDMILTNIDQYLQQDEENETAYLKLPADNYWWYWYGSEVEANAWYLKLLAATQPKNVRAPRLVKYLLNNRKHGTYWNSTRDTAYCVEAFADYIKASGELEPDMTVEVLINGKVAKEVSINKDNLFSFDGSLVVEGAKVPDGEHTITIRRKGQGPVYFNAYLTNFTMEDPIEKAGLEVKVERKFYRLVPVDKTIKVAGSRGQALDQRVEKFEREPLENLDEVVSGDLVEVELEIESKNDYEYVIFEDMKAAGFEANAVRSGHYSAGGLSAYRELRDDRVSFFVRTLARGKHSISYRLRAEIPGKFSALPARAYAMYAPELKGNSDEMKLQVVDEK